MTSNDFWNEIATSQMNIAKEFCNGIQIIPNENEYCNYCLNILL